MGGVALAQSSLTVSMAWSHGMGFVATSLRESGRTTIYRVGCPADAETCVAYRPFTLTQAPDAASFTTTVPGKPDSSVIHYCLWSGVATPGCGVSDNIGRGTSWATFYRDAEDYKQTRTVVPLVENAAFLTIPEPTTTTRQRAGQETTARAPAVPTPTELPNDGGRGGGDADDDGSGRGQDSSFGPGFGLGRTPESGGSGGFLYKGSLGVVVGIIVLLL